MTREEFIQNIALEGEEWEDVVGWEDLYYISSYGRIIRAKTNTCPMKLMHPYKQKNRKKTYFAIKLQTTGRRESWLVHRLVAMAFIPNPQNMKCVDHIDEDSTNNNISNLVWCTHHMNNINPIAILKESEAHRGKVNTAQNKEIVQIKDGKVVKIYRSITDAEKDGYTRTIISRICNGANFLHRGSQWMFLSDYESLNQ